MFIHYIELPQFITSGFVDVEACVQVRTTFFSNISHGLPQQMTFVASCHEN